YSTGYIPDLFPTLNLFGLRNSTSFLVGVLLAIIYCITQVRGWITRKKKAYEVESPWILALKVVIVSAAVIWLFYTLGAYRGVPKVLITVGIVLIAYGYFTTHTVMGRHLYALGGNEKAARLSGVKTRQLLFLAYVNMAF